MTSPLPANQYLVAFNNVPLDDPASIAAVAAPGTLGATGTWSDITQWVNSHAIARGRQHELAQFEAGTLALDLDNNAGTFNPWNRSSPFYGHIAPMKLVQVRSTWGGVTHTRFTGHINAWPVLWPDQTSGWSQLKASDAFRLFGADTINTAGLVEQLSGARVNHLLDMIGWPAGARVIDAGSTVIQADAQNQVATPVHGVLTSVDATEGGGLFMDSAGRVRFVARSALGYTPGAPTPYSSNQATIGDNPADGEIPFQPGPGLAIDDLDIYNRAVVTRQGGTLQQYDSPASQAEYGVHAWQPSSQTLYTSDAEALNRALYVVDGHSEPVTRLSSINIDLIDLIAPNLVGELLNLDLLYRVTVNRHAPPGGGDAFQQIGNIEHISETVTPNSWVVTLALAPAVDADLVGYWQWDVSTWGQTTVWN